MSENCTMVLAAVVEAYDFTGIETLVDVGGGQGALISGILKATPTLRGILFDQPNVIAGARGMLQDEGVAGAL
jgi:16S rRNA A1518/A1519 N6-dimethyltransferase RsmA/KsgA/DIM1 with predicted DNA glycosylase/AP lyase activity